MARGPHQPTLLPSGFRLSVLAQWRFPPWRSPAEGRQRGDEIRVWFSLASSPLGHHKQAASLCNSARPSRPCSLPLIPAAPSPSCLRWEHLPLSPTPGQYAIFGCCCSRLATPSHTGPEINSCPQSDAVCLQKSCPWLITQGQSRLSASSDASLVVWTRRVTGPQQRRPGTQGCP